MRVLHVDTGREWRGGQVQLALLAERTGDLVACPPGSPLHQRLGARGLARPVAFDGLDGGLLALRRLVRTLRPALVAVHTSQAHQRSLVLGVPVVVHRRVDFAPRRISWPKYRAAAGFVAVSDAVGRILVASGVAAGRVVVVPDGVDEPEVGPVPDIAGEGPLIGAVGALVPHKDHATLVRALARVRRPLRAVILGEGPERTRLEGLIGATGQRDRVHLLGHRPDAGRWIRAFELMVHPSREEGLGQVVLEAMRAGTPTLLTRAGGLPELAGDGARAALVRAGDPGAMAAAVDEALQHPDACADRAERARRWASAERSVEGMVEATLRAYERIASAR